MKCDFLQIAGKRNPEMDKEAQEWIETVLEFKFPGGETYEDVLKDGQVLCRLINKLKPGSVAKINESGGQFKMMENLNNFQKALKEYGVADVDVFQTVDLWEKKDISNVTNTIFALGRAVSFSTHTQYFSNLMSNSHVMFYFQTYKHPEWTGPNLGPKPADECKRDFTEEQLKAGQTIVGLQAGSNKGATQAGQNIGAGRKILLGK